MSEEQEEAEGTRNSPDELVIALASEFHEDWRNGRFNPETGSYEPRIKTTKDESWIEQHGTDQVDIANTTFADLPEDWQKENRDAASVVIGEIRKITKTGENLRNSQTIEHLAETVHIAWLSRNGSWAPAEQKVPYSQLSEAEKAKDRDQVTKGIKIYSDNSK